MSIEQRRNYGGRSKDSGKTTEQKIATGLGWFSVGLGLWELAAPGSLARVIGVEDRFKNRTLLRFYGLREMAAGAGLLSQTEPSPWLWARVAGDGVDLASLARSFSSDTSHKGKLALATAAVAGVTALDVYCGQRLTRKEDWTRPLRVSKTIIIGRPPEEVYRYWRNLENLPSFMAHLESVRQTGERTWHWRAKGPGGISLEWDSELVEDRPNEMMAWRTLPGSRLRSSGRVRFDPATGGRGTLVRIELELSPPGGALTANMAKLATAFGVGPQSRVNASLRALKQILETGEVIRSDSSIHRGMHAAQPPTARESQKLEPRSANLQPSLAGGD